MLRGDASLRWAVVTAAFFCVCVGSPALYDDLKGWDPLRGAKIQIPLWKDDPDEPKQWHKYRQWCDPVLGCLSISDDWFCLNRPINVMPDKRTKIRTRFYLHTREQPNELTNYIVSADNLTSLVMSPFDAKKPTKLIVHGFVDDGRTRWLKDMAQAMLKYGDFNVLRVDWGKGSQPMYYQAVANTRVVGLEIGHLINTLTATLNLNPKDVHCIGHSLGSHVCGYGGEQIDKLGRITGMDPAGPYFTGTPYFVHLDPTDAAFVDNIHTDADSIFLLGYGTAQPMGHLDFYPNSGHDQPGCNPVTIAVDAITDDMVDGGRDLVACSHGRAIQFFQESLDTNADCAWTAHECFDYDSFEQGECFSCGEDDRRCAPMGIRADVYPDKSRQFATFFLDTNKKDPYCMQHYEVRILTDSPKEAESWVMGRLYIWLYGDNEQVIEKVKITGNNERIDHGEIKTTMFLSQQDVGHVLRVELKWVYDDKIFNPGTYCWALVCNRSLYVKSVEVSTMNKYPESERQHFTSLTCSSDGLTTRIKDGKKASFMINSNCAPLQE